MTLWLWDEDGEFEGRFWLPDDDQRFYGRLRHDRRQGPEFHFFDCPGAKMEFRESPIPADSRILGTKAGGVPLTLDGFIPRDWTQYGLGEKDTTVDGFADAVFSGVHLDGDEQPMAGTLTSRLRGLEEALVGGQTNGGLLNPSAQRGKSRFARGEELAIDLVDGTDLLLWAGQQTSLQRHTEQTEVHAGLQITSSEPRPLEDLERTYLEPIREFVMFSTRRPSYIRSLTLHGEDPSDSVEVLRRPWPIPSREQGELYRLALNLGRVEAPDDVVRRWFGLRDDVGPVWSLFFATLDREHGYLENRFLNLLAFAEGYHRALRDNPPLSRAENSDAREAVKQALSEPKARRVYMDKLRYANSQSQKERLTDLAEQADTLLGESWDFDATQACREMVDTRNWITHWGSKTKHVAEDPASLVTFCRQLEVILYVAILRDLELVETEMADAVGHGWARERLP